MEILSKKNELCLCCMEIHDVLTIKKQETTIHDGKEIIYPVICNYCDKADVFFETEEQMSNNYNSLKKTFN